VLTTLIKQRKDSVEQFTKGGRQEMADREAAEITLIETYMPKAAGEAEIVAGVQSVIAEMGTPTMKDMGTVMKNVMAKFAARVCGRWESGERSGKERTPAQIRACKVRISTVTLSGASTSCNNAIAESKDPLPRIGCRSLLSEFS